MGRSGGVFRVVSCLVVALALARNCNCQTDPGADYSEILPKDGQVDTMSSIGYALLMEHLKRPPSRLAPNGEPIEHGYYVIDTHRRPDGSMIYPPDHVPQGSSNIQLHSYDFNNGVQQNAQHQVPTPTAESHPHSHSDQNSASSIAQQQHHHVPQQNQVYQPEFTTQATPTSTSGLTSFVQPPHINSTLHYGGPSHDPFVSAQDEGAYTTPTQVTITTPASVSHEFAHQQQQQQQPSYQDVNQGFYQDGSNQGQNFFDFLTTVPPVPAVSEQPPQPYDIHIPNYNNEKSFASASQQSVEQNNQNPLASLSASLEALRKSLAQMQLISNFTSNLGRIVAPTEAPQAEQQIPSTTFSSQPQQNYYPQEQVSTTEVPTVRLPDDFGTHVMTLHLSNNHRQEEARRPQEPQRQQEQANAAQEGRVSSSLYEEVERLKEALTRLESQQRQAENHGFSNAPNGVETAHSAPVPFHHSVPHKIPEKVAHVSRVPVVSLHNRPQSHASSSPANGVHQTPPPTVDIFTTSPFPLGSDFSVTQSPVVHSQYERTGSHLPQRQHQSHTVPTTTTPYPPVTHRYPPASAKFPVLTNDAMVQKAIEALSGYSDDYVNNQIETERRLQQEKYRIWQQQQEIIRRQQTTTQRSTVPTTARASGQPRPRPPQKVLIAMPYPQTQQSTQASLLIATPTPAPVSHQYRQQHYKPSYEGSRVPESHAVNPSARPQIQNNFVPHQQHQYQSHHYPAQNAHQNPQQNYQQDASASASSSANIKPAYSRIIVRQDQGTSSQSQYRSSPVGHAVVPQSQSAFSNSEASSYPRTVSNALTRPLSSAPDILFDSREKAEQVLKTAVFPKPERAKYSTISFRRPETPQKSQNWQTDSESVELFAN